MPDISQGRRFTLGEVASRLGVHVSSAWRWVLRGVRGRKLPTVFIGGRRFVLEHDLNAFLAGDEQGCADGEEVRRRRADAAGKILDAAGVTPLTSPKLAARPTHPLAERGAK